ncbi:WYL domain-containing protein [Saccharothrix violaceirubra]|uniref:Putative DNA-binding transcriptional regulator YafY n=1 Tax=Saccharothrix violaceirubra TaxID=413306 RepID=A0A7W7T4R1_9PSEU|nr:WYL domain-containing protein [Saccharothrix violaceirubra]MBB4966548.1 putative DNA-binding transcriptional regulator YafY [Saccharothrix violaceirubra]
MGDNSARLLRLLALLQARQEWGGPDLAERLEVSARTVRRDVERLRESGYPVDSVGGVGGGYRLGIGGALPPLLLDDDEAVALAVGLRTTVALTGIAETSVRALAKLDRILPSRSRHRVDAVAAAVVATPASGAAVDTATLTAIASAVRDHHRLRFDYVDGGGRSAVREVEPYRLVHNGRRWYLFAWDVGRRDWRTFRADRVRPRVPAGPAFRPRDLPADDVAKYLVHGLTTARHRHRAVFLLHASAHDVAEVVPATVGLVEPVDGRTCTLSLGSDEPDPLLAWVASFGFDFEVREPPELVARLRSLTDRLKRAVERADRSPQ